MVTILIMSAKMSTLGLLKLKVFSSKGHDVIIFFRELKNKVLLRVSRHIVDMVM